MEEMLSLSEEDIKLRYITPSICNKGWSFNDISMEAKVKLTDGKINLSGNLVARSKAKFADYVLYYNRATPIALRAGTGMNQVLAPCPPVRPTYACPHAVSAARTTHIVSPGYLRTVLPPPSRTYRQPTVRTTIHGTH